MGKQKVRGRAEKGREKGSETFREGEREMEAKEKGKGMEKERDGNGKGTEAENEWFGLRIHQSEAHSHRVEPEGWREDEGSGRAERPQVLS